MRSKLTCGCEYDGPFILTRCSTHYLRDVSGEQVIREGLETKVRELELQNDELREFCFKRTLTILLGRSEDKSGAKVRILKDVAELIDFSKYEIVQYDSARGDEYVIEAREKGKTEKREGLTLGESRNLPYPKPISNDEARYCVKCGRRMEAADAAHPYTCEGKGDAANPAPFID